MTRLVRSRTRLVKARARSLTIISHEHFNIIGGWSWSWGSGIYHDYILQFNPDDGSWKEVGQLQQSRNYHGASLVNVEDVIRYCQ